MKLDSKELMERLRPLGGNLMRQRFLNWTVTYLMMSVKNGTRFTLRSPRGHCFGIR